MDKFEYLTINNITKLYSNTIYTNSEDEVLSYQWFPFQLEYAFEKLGLQLYNNGLRYTNKQMGDILKSFFSNKSVEISDTRDGLVAMGLYGDSKVQDTYTIINQGGHLLFKPEINEYGSSIKKPIGKTHYSLDAPKKRLIQIRKLVPNSVKKQHECRFKDVNSNNPTIDSILYLLTNYMGLDTNRSNEFKKLLDSNSNLEKLVVSDKLSNLNLICKDLFEKLKLSFSDHNVKHTYLFSDKKHGNLNIKVEDFYFGYSFPQDSYDKLLVSSNDNKVILANIGSSKLIRFYDSLKVKNYSDIEVNDNPELFEEDLELGIMTKKRGVDKLNTILKKNKIEVSIEQFINTKTVSLPVPALKKDLDFNLKGVVIENKITAISDYIFISIDRKIQKIKDGEMRQTVTNIKVKPIEILKIENSSYYLSGLICMLGENNYLSIVRCNNKYISNRGEIGDYEKLLEYQINIDQKLIKELVMRTCVLVFYEKL